MQKRRYFRRPAPAQADLGWPARQVHDFFFLVGVDGGAGFTTGVGATTGAWGGGAAAT